MYLWESVSEIPSITETCPGRVEIVSGLYIRVPKIKLELGLYFAALETEISACLVPHCLLRFR